MFLGTNYIINHKSHITEFKYVDVKIVAEIFNVRQTSVINKDADTEIVVEYKDQPYSLCDYDTYAVFHNKVGETVKARVKITKYRDGKEKVKILNLINTNGE